MRMPKWYESYYEGFKEAVQPLLDVANIVSYAPNLYETIKGMPEVIKQDSFEPMAGKIKNPTLTQRATEIKQWMEEEFPKDPAEWDRKLAEGWMPPIMPAAGVTTAIPKPFRSEWLDRIKKYAPSFPKKATGAEILGQLENKAILPKGYGEYYLRPQVEAFTPEQTMSLRSDVPLDITTLPGNKPLPNRNQLIPYLEENWVNPRIDVRSRSGREFVEDITEPKWRPRSNEELIKQIKDDYAAGYLTEDEYRRALYDFAFAKNEIGYGPNILENKYNRDQITKLREQTKTRHSGSQILFDDLADDYYELLVKPRRGLDIPVPEKLKEGGHWGDPSVMAHVRGEQIGPRHIVQEVQGDWNRVKQLKNLYENQEPYNVMRPTFDEMYEAFGKNYNIDPKKVRDIIPSFERFEGPWVKTPWTVNTGLGEYPFSFHTSREEALEKLANLSYELGNVPQLPPELSRAWPEVGAKAALAYGARNPDIQRVSFVDELIAAAARNLDPAKTTGIYGQRIPNFLRKYTRTHGGIYYPEQLQEFNKAADKWNYTQRLQFDLGNKALSLGDMPYNANFHTIELGEWNSPWRKFLRGQQPLAVAPVGLAAWLGLDREQ